MWWYGMNTDKQKWKEQRPIHNPKCILKLVHSEDKGGLFNKCFEDK